MCTKQEIRERVWKQLEEQKLGRFPFPLKNRIPNFKGAEKAAHFVFTMEEYKRAKVVKVNPDSPQLPIREQVLKDGKTLLVPTPRLRAGFIMVKPEWVPPGEERKAASLNHIKKYGKELALFDLPPIDLIVVGSVALNPDGRRVGKGEGYADREYAIIREIGNDEIPVISTVHSIQVVQDNIPINPYDLTVDWIVTEKGIHKTNSPYKKPTGIIWEEVTDKELEIMPVLKEIREMTKGKSEQN